MFQIYYWNPETQIWVDYMKTHESEASQKRIAENMAKSADPMEYVGSFVSWLADQVGWPIGDSAGWKVVGPPGYTIPSYLGARYEVIGKESNDPPNY
jgi:hypothetical protein